MKAKYFQPYLHKAEKKKASAKEKKRERKKRHN